ncbi:hypothetical protein LZ198_00490 [Myxococcus sp. K15C18031901]|uniref:hypothetical protein n=1 Tax=Myxococcus dinghuensis TaxID=2906761 RepID=UPI0020A72265|nr:hypothetical protein [Myxococcus dinghuensis]MCP3097342.1 hypothetical protein [Myxococcus dinghuensis]
MSRAPGLRLLLLAASLLSSPGALAAGGGVDAPVTLRWKVPPASLGYEYTAESVAPEGSSMRVDLSSIKLRGVPPAKRQQMLELRQPTESAMALVLSPQSSGSVSARLVVTRVQLPKTKPSSKEAREVAQRMKAMEGTVQVRATLTASGLVTSDLKREERNLVALMVELPSRPVSVGDVWTHSADLLDMGKRWNGKGDTLNRVELVALEREAEGRTVAVIDFTLAERHAGRYEDPSLLKPIPATMEMAYVGRGEFLVEEGRWRRVAGQMSTRTKGVVSVDSAQRFVMVPLDPVPPEVLSAQ